MKKIQPLLVALAALILSGCSNVTTYRDAPNKNLHGSVKLKDDDSRIRADLDIYAEVDKCNDTYIGSVELDKPVVDIGIPPGKKLHLTYVVTRKGFVKGRRTLNLLSSLDPRPGYEYYAEFSWENGMYKLELFESLPHRKERHQIPLNPAPGC